MLGSKQELQIIVNETSIQLKPYHRIILFLEALGKLMMIYICVLNQVIKIDENLE